MGSIAVDPVQVAADKIRDGELVAFATETVYGLGARADDEDAVAKIFALKGRPATNPLIVHILDIDAAGFAAVGNTTRKLAAAFWPGPLTLVLPLRDRTGLAPSVLAGNDSVAVRSPSHPVARALLTASAQPIAAPSANRSGQISPTTPDHVRAAFGDDLPLLDGGPCKAGLESTILSLLDPAAPTLLRPGTVTRRQIEEILDAPVALFASLADKTQTQTAPGQLISHYAPNKPVLLNQTVAPDDAVMIGFGSFPGDLMLSETADLSEAAQRLFALLHEADRHPAPRIAVAPIPVEGIGRAINDRLTRAAAPRDR